HAIAPGDALGVINYINAFGAGKVDPLQPPALFCDVDGDGFIAPNDALIIINRINAGVGGEGEGVGDRESGVGEAELLTLLAMDQVQVQSPRSKVQGG